MHPDSTLARSSWILSISLLILILSGCAGPGVEREVTETQPPEYDQSTTFPVPPEIRDNVDFWRHVYGIWSRGQVAIHDDEHLGVIYEVARLPGPIQAGYSNSQQAWLDARTDYYVSRLKLLEERVRTGQDLSASDRDLLAKFEKSGGTGALYGAADRVRAQRGLRERFRRGLEISGRYDQSFREIMRKHGVPEDLAYLPHVESSFQTNARSSVGAGGVWQFMPSTGRTYMTVNGSVDERYDPILAAEGAARYLSQAHSKLGSWPLAITSYNHGQGGMAKAKAYHGKDIGRIVKDYDGPAFGFASRNFYSEFIAAREVASHPERYFPEGVRFEEPWSYDRLVLRHSMPADHVAQHYGTSSDRLADLNLHWRDPVRHGKAHLPAGTTIWLPRGSLQRVADHPAPVPVMLARTEPASNPIDLVNTLDKPGNTKSERLQKVAKAIAEPKGTKPTPKVVTNAKAPTPPKSAKKGSSKASQDSSKVRYHVVKPKETLYRVAVQNGLSVAELRRLNQMSASDNNIRPGQRLKVGI